MGGSGSVCVAALAGLRVLVCVVLAGTLLVSGCGNGDDGAIPEIGDDGAGGEPAGGDAQARAEAAVLELEDLPAGWNEQAEEDRPDHQATWQQLAQCLEIDDPEQVAAGSATSPTFVSGIATQVTSSVAYLETEEQVQAAAAAYTGEQFLECAQTAFAGDLERNAPEGATAEDVEVSELEFPELGDATVAQRVTATIHIGEITLPLFMDVVVVFNDDAVSRMVFLNPGGPFPEELQRSLAEKVAGRV